MLNHDEQDKFPADLEELIINPKIVKNATPDEWYCYLKNSGYRLKPLRRGSFENKLYEEGGGFRINWGGDRIFQYHPPGGKHHGGIAYWKLSAGEFGRSHGQGTRRFDLDGNEIFD